MPSASACSAPGSGGSVTSAHVRAVDLLGLQPALLRDADQLADAPAVLLDGGHVVVRVQADVELLERLAGDAAAAREEQRATAGQLAADVIADRRERRLQPIAPDVAGPHRGRDLRFAVPWTSRLSCSTASRCARARRGSPARPRAAPRDRRPARRPGAGRAPPAGGGRGRRPRRCPAARRSSPVICRPTWRSSSSQRRAAAAPPPRAPASATASTGRPRSARASCGRRARGASSSAGAAAAGAHDRALGGA